VALAFVLLLRASLITNGFEVVRGRGLTIGKAKPLYSSCSQFGIIVHTVVLRPYRPLAARGPGSNPP